MYNIFIYVYIYMQFPADLVPLPEKTDNEKLHFVCSV